MGHLPPLQGGGLLGGHGLGHQLPQLDVLAPGPLALGVQLPAVLPPQQQGGDLGADGGEELGEVDAAVGEVGGEVLRLRPAPGQEGGGGVVEGVDELIQGVGPENVPLVFACITNNPICGQAVSMANLREINRVAHKYNIPLVFDAARWAENAYFIKTSEEGYADKSIAEMFSYCDAFTMSAKKDGHANMGGMLAFRDRGLFWKNFSDFNPDGSVKTDVGVLLKVKQISCYGNDSYGGMSGRDIMALAVGLYESCNFGYLDERIAQCNYLAEGFYKAGVKGVVLPAGGHAVYINIDEFFDGKRGHDTFAGQGFSVELIRRYGIRVSELGDYSMEYDLKTPEQQAELANVVRFAIDRSRLTQEHLDYVIAAVKALYEDRESIPNMRIVWGRNLPMRHFHAFLEPYDN